MIRNLLIRFLFWLLGQRHEKTYTVSYLFGGLTGGHKSRKRRWERALARMWKDKDLLDFLYYQAECDKENVFRGKVARDLSRGARIRTLFLAYSAQRAYLEQRKRTAETAQTKANVQEDIAELQKNYKELVSMK